MGRRLQRIFDGERERIFCLITSRVEIIGVDTVKSETRQSKGAHLSICNTLELGKPRSRELVENVEGFVSQREKKERKVDEINIIIRIFV